MHTITVLGDGAWGTAIAFLLADKGYDVLVWCHNVDVAQAINTTHYNHRFLPHILLPKNIRATSSLQEALSHAQWIFEAIPVVHLRAVLRNAQPYAQKEHKWVILSKGIEQETLQLPSQILDDIFGADVRKAVVAGPSFAHDLVRKQPTAVSLASPDDALASSLQALMVHDYFRPYIALDYRGVQVGSAMKNVLALAIGMLDGAGYEDNTKAFVLTRGLAEIGKVVRVFGGNPQTLYGLSGMGDLVLTAMGKHSRNVAIGMRIGRGESLQDVASEIDSLPEGVNTSASLARLMQMHTLDIPVCAQVYKILFEGQTVQGMVHELMHRPLEHE